MRQHLRIHQSQDFCLITRLDIFILFDYSQHFLNGILHQSIGSDHFRPNETHRTQQRHT
jgi:hypothetical protein